MYLSRIELDIRRRETLSALAYPVVMHGAIEDSFDRKDERKLWRIDTLGDKTYLLLLSQSELKPDHLIEQFSPKYDTHPRESFFIQKDYDPLLNRIENGQKYQFRLCANPVHNTRKNKDNTSSERKRLAHVTHEQQCDWLLKRAESLGFSLEQGDAYTASDGSLYHTHPSFEVVSDTWKIFQKGNSQTAKVTLRQTTFEGVLTVSKVDLFKEKLTQGIGHGKAYGCGLMTIIRIL